MIKELKEKLIVLNDALAGVIDAIDKYVDEEVTIDGGTDMYSEVLDELQEVPDTPMYEPDNVFEDEDGFSVSLECDPEEGDEFDYYVTPYHELVVTTSGVHGNSEFATSQTVDIPVGYAVKRIYHKFKDGNIVVIVPKKKNICFPFNKKRRPTDFNYIHQKRDKKGRFICMR